MNKYLTDTRGWHSTSMSITPNLVTAGDLRIHFGEMMIPLRNNNVGCDDTLQYTCSSNPKATSPLRSHILQSCIVDSYCIDCVLIFDLQANVLDPVPMAEYIRVSLRPCIHMSGMYIYMSSYILSSHGNNILVLCSVNQPGNLA